MGPHVWSICYPTQKPIVYVTKLPNERGIEVNHSVWLIYWHHSGGILRWNALQSLPGCAGFEGLCWRRQDRPHGHKHRGLHLRYTVSTAPSRVGCGHRHPQLVCWPPPPALPLACIDQDWGKTMNRINIFEWFTTDIYLLLKKLLSAQALMSVVTHTQSWLCPRAHPWWQTWKANCKEKHNKASNWITKRCTVNF